MANQKVNTNTAAQNEEEVTVENTATNQNHERKSKTHKQRVEGMKNCAEGAAKNAGRLAKSGAKAIGRGATSLTREVIADAAGGAAGIVTTMVVGGLVNRCLVDAVNMADYAYSQKHPHTLTVSKSFGRKETLSEGEYYKALAKGKKFKKVVGSDWVVDHRKTIDNGLATASYAMGAGAGVAAGLTTRTVVKGQLIANSQANEVYRRVADGSDFEENGQV